MKKTSLSHSVFLCVSLLAGCSELPKQAYYDHGQPESLMVHSKKDAHFSITSKDSVKEILQWAEQKKPSEATLHCREANKFCNKIEQAMERSGVAVIRVSSYRNSVNFTYDSVAARNCENRYIDNMINPYNLNHPTFGCSIAANIAQMADDKHQITDPDIMDSADARKGVQALDQYNAPSKAETSFAPISTSASLATSTGGTR